jgi:hypothetical protein
MDPDLVGAAGLQPAPQVGIAAVPLQDLPVGHGVLPIHPVNSHPLPVHRVAGDGGVHGAEVLPKAPHRHGMVFPVEAVVLQLGGQGQVGGVVFRRDEKPRGVPVDPVDDAGTELSVDSGQAISAVI